MTRNTSIEPPDFATNAQRPSGVTATPNGLPDTANIAVRAELSAPDADVAVEQPGERSALAGSGGSVTRSVAAADDPWEAAGGRAEPGVQPGAPGHDGHHCHDDFTHGSPHAVSLEPVAVTRGK